MDATDASISAALGRPRVEVARCTHWPDRAHCGQDCLKQPEAAPPSARRDVAVAPLNGCLGW